MPTKEFLPFLALLENAKTNYQAAIDVAQENLKKFDALYLGLILNMAVFHHEHLNDSTRGIIMLKDVSCVFGGDELRF
jgi:hypothetical protein